MSGSRYEAGFASVGLTHDRLAMIGIICILAAHVETYVDKACFHISEICGAGRAKWKDGSPISASIEYLENQADAVPTVEQLIKVFTPVARSAFNIRNTILHGQTINHGQDWVEIAKNLPINGKDRKRSMTNFHITPTTLPLLVEVFDGLVGGSRAIYLALTSPREQGSNEGLIAVLRRAYITSVEIEDLAAVINDEKY